MYYQVAFFYYIGISILLKMIWAEFNLQMQQNSD